ncbi:MAG: TetR/AcrR family transcriptional regulator [Desulfamplus sp.]|nr:TetR/AcrR family transcriptional regulator [Desulfamplus sp.]
MMTISRKERDDQRRREDILNASLSIFATQGFHGTTMAQISQESQYPLGTIYKYFPSKKKIYHDLVMERVHQLGKIFFEISIRKDLSSIEKLKKSFFAKALFYKQNSEFIRIYISERSTIDAVMMPKLNAKVNRMHEKEVALFQTIFEEAGEDTFKNYPPGEMALLFSEITHSVAWASLFENSTSIGNPPSKEPSSENDVDENPAQRVNMVFDMFINGVAK